VASLSSYCSDYQAFYLFIFIDFLLSTNDLKHAMPFLTLNFETVWPFQLKNWA